MLLLQGILYDEKSSYQRGPAGAPPLIRAALSDGSMNAVAEDGTEIVFDDRGDFAVAEYFDIATVTARHLAGGGRLITLGGDHSITFPLLRAHRQRYPKLDILHIDAHADLYNTYEGDPHSHACPFARIMDEGLADRLVQVGIRTLNAHQAAQAKKFGVEIHPMRGLDLARVPTSFANPLYISLDLDGIDPAFAPGVSHHEPGGLTTRQVIDLIQSLDAEIVGADIVEYNPLRDVQRTTAFLAAKLLKEIAARMQ